MINRVTAISLLLILSYCSSNTEKTKLPKESETIKMPSAEDLSRDRSAKYSEIGWKKFNSEDYDSAKWYFRMSIMEDSTNSRSYWGLGLATSVPQSFRQGKEYLELAIQLDSSNIELTFDLAEYYLLDEFVDGDSIGQLRAEYLVDFVLQHRTSKEIAEIYNVSDSVINFFRSEWQTNKTNKYDTIKVSNMVIWSLMYDFQPTWDYLSK